MELDVRCARDQIVVVCHDPDLRRVAARPERVCDLDASALGRIDVGGDTIPRLDDALEEEGEEGEDAEQVTPV